MDPLLIPLNLLFFLLLAPLLEGVIRRVTARVQSRQGPPLVQPWLDILKLLGKEDMTPAGGVVFRFAPAFALASILAAVAVLPLAGRANPLTARADAISLVYLLTLGGVAVLLGALASGNPFAGIGASREMITMIMVEPILVMLLMLGIARERSLDLGAILYGSPNAAYGAAGAVMALVTLLALQAFVGRQPFDIPEAECELLGGPLVEFSGPSLALFKLYLMLKQMFYAWLPVAMFLPLTGTGILALDLAAQTLGTLAVFVLIGLLGATHPRFRIDQAIRYYALLLVVSFCAIGGMLCGS